MAFMLPLSVVGQGDVRRLLRELNYLNDALATVASRHDGLPIQPPKTTAQLNDLAAANSLNLLEEEGRKNLNAQLNDLLKSAPELHLSFASEPNTLALQKIIQWLREYIHPVALITVGLQPNMAAGCVLRTPNKVFDMSLKNYLAAKQPYLLELIRGSAS